MCTITLLRITSIIVQYNRHCIFLCKEFPNDRSFHSNGTTKTPKHEKVIDLPITRGKILTKKKLTISFSFLSSLILRSPTVSHSIMINDNGYFTYRLRNHCSRL